MNSGTTRIFKPLALTLLLLMASACLFSLNFNASLNRFLNQKKQTTFEINYKIFNDQLTFVKDNNYYKATIDVNFKIKAGDKEVINKDFTNYAGALTEASAKSSNYFTLDKISLTLSKNGYTAIVTVTDRNSKLQSSKTFELVTIDPNALSSDLELSHNIKPDTTSYLEKFHRGDLLFYVDPIPIYASPNDSLFIYYEVYNISKNQENSYVFNENIRVKKADSVYVDIDNPLESESLPCQRYLTVPVKDLQDGLYEIEITVTDLITKKTYTTKSSFSKTKPHIIKGRVFEDNESEYALLNYFLNSKEKKKFKLLDDAGKENYIDKFWKKSDFDPQTEKNEFLEDLKKRIEYANWHWSHYDKGWMTDLGRIYIRYGMPNQVIEKQTDVSAKFGKKDYKIWKYNNGSRVYIFMDIYSSGRFVLIYAKNDDTEKSDPNWKKYLGSDWDSGELENDEMNDNEWMKGSYDGNKN